MSEHTPGQLKVGHRGYIYASKSGKGIDEPVVAEPRHSISISASERKANASHLVACWNACEGINPKAVPELLKVLKACSKVAKSGESDIRGLPWLDIDAAIVKAEEGEE